jgi:hypothetical protein
MGSLQTKRNRKVSIFHFNDYILLRYNTSWIFNTVHTVAMKQKIVLFVNNYNFFLGLEITHLLFCHRNPARLRRKKNLPQKREAWPADLKRSFLVYLFAVKGNTGDRVVCSGQN